MWGASTILDPGSPGSPGPPETKPSQALFAFRLEKAYERLDTGQARQARQARHKPDYPFSLPAKARHNSRNHLNSQLHHIPNLKRHTPSASNHPPIGKTHLYFGLSIPPAVQGHVFMDWGFKVSISASPHPYLQTTLPGGMPWYRGPQRATVTNDFDSFRIRAAKHLQAGVVARTEIRK
ncbi:hypothetical protein EAF00_000566 [Botryotinia globosa]|nr:hypothetical protein EAF00_000566 [Botryotinia globosa]